MTGHHHCDNDGGYTLAELAVGLAVTALIGMIAAYLVIGTASGLERSLREAEQVQSAHTAWRHLSDELRRADNVALFDEGWSVFFADSSVRYVMTDEGLLRDGRPFVPAPGTRLQGRLTALTVGDSLLAHALDVVAAGRDDVAITSIVRRAPRARWHPLADR